MQQVPLTTLEQWLVVLITHYQAAPSCNLARCIHCYAKQISEHEELANASLDVCHYSSMLRFWQWRANLAAE